MTGIDIGATIRYAGKACRGQWCEEPFHADTAFESDSEERSDEQRQALNIIPWVLGTLGVSEA